MSDSHDRLRAAARARAGNGQPAEPEHGPEGPSAVSPPAPMPEPTPGEVSAGLPAYTGPSILDEPDDDLTGDPELVSAVVAWSRVMSEVRSIAKLDRFSAKGAGTFNFRGVDLALNAFGPACRRHGVVVAPHDLTPVYTERRSKEGNTGRDCTVRIAWRIYGPAGDFIEAVTYGEALDFTGRSTSKAVSVGLRILLLTLGLVPTEERDPEAIPVDRGEVVRPTPGEYMAEILAVTTPRERYRQIWGELQNHRMTEELVTPAEGAAPESLRNLYRRIGVTLGYFGAPAQDQAPAAPAAPVGRHKPTYGDDGVTCTVPGCGQPVDAEEVHEL